MSDCIPDLAEATADLAAVLDAGLLEQLKGSINAARRRNFPGGEYKAHPKLKCQVEEYGGLLADFTGLPMQLCRLAALNQLLPGNNNQAALEILHQFAEHARAAANQERASTIIAAERRRLAGRRAS